MSVKRATPVSTVTNTSWAAGAPGARSGVVAVELPDPGPAGTVRWGVPTPAGGALELGAGSETSEGGGGTGCSDIIQEKSTSLTAVDQPGNPAWAFMKGCIGREAGTSAVEGPSVFKANEGDTSGSSYYLFVDEYGGRGYIPLGTDDLENPSWRVPAAYSLPASPRHGTVIPVTQAELDRVREPHARGDEHEQSDDHGQLELVEQAERAAGREPRVDEQAIRDADEQRAREQGVARRRVLDRQHDREAGHQHGHGDVCWWPFRWNDAGLRRLPGWR